MTIEEMHTYVKLGLDKSSALDIPSFEPEEIDYWINKAIIRFIKTRYSGVNLKKESFEQTQKRTDDLSALVKEAKESDGTLGLPLTADTDYPNSYIIDGYDTPTITWPTDYLLTISEEVAVDEVDSIAQSPTLRWGVIQCTHDQYRQKIDDPYSEHILHYGSAKPLRLFDDSQVRLITDGDYTLSRYYLTYLREPATVDIDGSPAVDCDLPEHTHEEIVDLTVLLMLENIEQPRFKTQSELVATME